MAKSKNSTASTNADPKANDDVEDAVVVDDEAGGPDDTGTEKHDAEPADPKDEHAEVIETTEAEDLDKTTSEEETPGTDDTVSDAEAADDNLVDAASEIRIDDEPPEEAAPETEPSPVPVAPPAPAPQVTVQKVGFTPLVLGGIVAAALGFGAAYVGFGQQGPDLTTELSERLSSLEAEVAMLPTAMPDLSPLESSVAAVQSDLASQIAEISQSIDTQIAAFDERLTGIERAPSVDGTLAESAIASWEQELDMLRAEIAAQQGRMQEIATSAQSELDATRAAAQEVEQNAVMAAQQAVARAALARVQVALDSGTPFDSALADLADSGIEVPDTLTSIALDGVPTIAMLRDDFPAAARAALSAARSEGLADSNANSLTAFFRNQLDVRSVVPKEGDDPDAILSRAEAALADNRLTDALAEVASLPEVARGEMSAWMGLAETRASAMSTVESLAQTLNN